MHEGNDVYLRERLQLFRFERMNVIIELFTRLEMNLLAKKERIAIVNTFAILIGRCIQQ